MASFMAKVSYEREKTNHKLERLTKVVDVIETQINKDGGSNEKMLDYLNTKTMKMEKQVQDIAYEQTTAASFKKKQIQVIIKEVDELLEHKGEFKQKTDYLFEKMKTMQTDLDGKIVKMLTDLESIRTPLMNRVNNIFEVSKLYH